MNAPASSPEPEPLYVYTVYGPTTSDYPGEFVVRRWHGEGGEPVPDPDLYARGLTLESVRWALPPGLVRLARAASDDPVILETWL